MTSAARCLITVPRYTDQYFFGADNDADGTIAMAVALHINRHAARHCAGHPVGRNPSARHFGHADRHPDATEAVRHSRDGGGDHLCVGMGVAAHLVLPAVNFAAQRCALQQDIFQPKAKALF